ncbi:hypothetical protein F6B93_14625 [Mycobacterium spongiae]|uniref:Uncharacterized protein n=2 Tax=Mycobacterium spongiae TaxID=886343 RepID=A0A975PZK8_9MYCO|nr:hypothetical protein F6B93_14625 [Mycobacterium spongiae]
MLVIGRVEFMNYETEYGIVDDGPRFRPMAVRWGSANWTEGSRNHLEVGCVSRDAQLLDAATHFVADVIAFSEPLASECAGPGPNIVTYEVDDAAM